MDEFAKKRAEKAQDCRLWTPIDALEDVIKEFKQRDLDMKNVSIAIHWFEKEKESDIRQHYWCCGNITFPEHITLLNVGLHRVIDSYIIKS